jgi:hypothetical protein
VKINEGIRASTFTIVNGLQQITEVLDNIVGGTTSLNASMEARHLMASFSLMDMVNSAYQGVAPLAIGPVVRTTVLPPSTSSIHAGIESQRTLHDLNNAYSVAIRNHFGIRANRLSSLYEDVSKPLFDRDGKPRDIQTFEVAYALGSSHNPTTIKVFGNGGDNMITIEEKKGASASEQSIQGLPPVNTTVSKIVIEKPLSYCIELTDKDLKAVLISTSSYTDGLHQLQSAMDIEYKVGNINTLIVSELTKLYGTGNSTTIVPVLSQTDKWSEDKTIELKLGGMSMLLSTAEMKQGSNTLSRVGGELQIRIRSNITTDFILGCKLATTSSWIADKNTIGVNPKITFRHKIRPKDQEQALLNVATTSGRYDNTSRDLKVMYKSISAAAGNDGKPIINEAFFQEDESVELHALRGKIGYPDHGTGIVYMEGDITMDLARIFGKYVPTTSSDKHVPIAYVDFTSKERQPTISKISSSKILYFVEYPQVLRAFTNMHMSKKTGETNFTDILSREMGRAILTNIPFQGLFEPILMKLQGEKRRFFSMSEKEVLAGRVLVWATSCVITARSDARGKFYLLGQPLYDASNVVNDANMAPETAMALSTMAQLYCMMCSRTSTVIMGPNKATSNNLALEQPRGLNLKAELHSVPFVPESILDVLDPMWEFEPISGWNLYRPSLSILADVMRHRFVRTTDGSEAALGMATKISERDLGRYLGTIATTMPERAMLHQHSKIKQVVIIDRAGRAFSLDHMIETMISFIYGYSDQKKMFPGSPNVTYAFMVQCSEFRIMFWLSPRNELNIYPDPKVTIHPVVRQSDLRLNNEISRRKTIQKAGKTITAPISTEGNFLSLIR